MNLSLFAIIILFSMPIIFAYGESRQDIDFMIYKGIQYTKLGEYETAISIFENVLNEDKHNVQALVELGKSYSSLKKYDEAIDRFETALRIDQNNFIALYGLQNALVETTSYGYGFVDGILEIKVHDSQGGLVAFQRVTDILALEHKITNNLIEKWPVLKIITRNNQNFALHQQEFVEVLDWDTIIGFHQIHFSETVNLPLASTWFYQIPVEKGDVVTYVYSIFMPL